MANDNHPKFLVIRKPNPRMDTRSDCFDPGIFDLGRPRTGFPISYISRVQLDTASDARVKARDVPSGVELSKLPLRKYTHDTWTDLTVRLCPVGAIFIEASKSYLSPDCDVRTWPLP